MQRELIHTAHRRRRLHGWAAAGLAVLLFTVSVLPAHAASVLHEPEAAVPAQSLTETAVESASEAPPEATTEYVVIELAEEELPPLPFNFPQVGPLIRRGFQDDVDRRTTAFIPRNLDRLTPIEMPEGEERWIRIDLSEQLLIAYEGTTPVRGFVISSGRAATPTVTGTFRIRMKVRSQTMSGGSPALGTYYNLPNVQWVQYFYADYGIHGTYWHNNFGQPMSHGCVNMTNADAKWLFDWAGPKWDGKTVWFPARPDNPGTLVIVHP